MKLLNSISKKLAASFCLVLVLLAGISAFSWLALVQASATNGQMTKATALLLVVGELRKTHLTSSILVRDIVSNTDIAEQSKSKALLAQQSENAKRAWLEINKLVTAADSDLSIQLQDVMARQSKADVVLKRALALIDNALYDEASLLVYGELRPLHADISDRLTQIQRNLAAQATAASNDANQRNAANISLILVVAIAAITLGIIASIGISRAITKPMKEALQVAKAISTGDLTSTIIISSQDEIGMLMQALSDMQSKLHRIVSNIDITAHSISVGTHEITSGNTDLSIRTEKQAASLEETAASMDEMASTVKRNADNAKQANILASEASAVAVKGGAVVSNVVRTMSDINASSKKIVDIISVIDGIAFQTNILALNAAVEAARAGEQGRGFAVVAAEVRSLAQRSAIAAKEIKQLIGDSVEKVSAGKELVGEAGETMDEIVAAVKTVSDIVSAIAAASHEQSVGIDQVNNAITIMDEVVQQNAALVEEAAAATASLEAKAQDLTNATGVFTLQVKNQRAHKLADNQPAYLDQSAANMTKPWITTLAAATLAKTRLGSVKVPQDSFKAHKTKPVYLKAA